MPTATGTFSFTGRVSDAGGFVQTTNKTLILTVLDPLVITTTSLPSGISNVAYSSTLTASGGKSPYTWSLIGGSLPAGLLLSQSNGVISGTPTATGIVNFIVQVKDDGNPFQTTNKSLNIAIVHASAMTIWPSTTVPGVADGGPDSAVELGVKFRSDVAWDHHRDSLLQSRRQHRQPTSATCGRARARGWLRRRSAMRPPRGGSRRSSPRRWRSPPTRFTWPRITPTTDTTAPMSITSWEKAWTIRHCMRWPMACRDRQRRLCAMGASSAFPTETWNAANYWVDVMFSAGSLAASSNADIHNGDASKFQYLDGSLAQFTATGTYSDGSMQNLTSQATWISSNTGVATINAGGLAIGIPPAPRRFRRRSWV